MQLIEGISSKEELQELCRLLDFIAHEISHNSNFEFMQALLRLVLQVSCQLLGKCTGNLISGWIWALTDRTKSPLLCQRLIRT